MDFSRSRASLPGVTALLGPLALCIRKRIYHSPPILRLLPAGTEGLGTIIASQPDMILASQATDAAEALAEFRRLRPDITLMDLRLPGTNGIDAPVATRGEFAHARIVILTASESDEAIQRPMRAEASGYVLKSMPKNELLGVIRTVHAGRRYLPPEVAARDLPCSQDELLRTIANLIELLLTLLLSKFWLPPGIRTLNVYAGVCI